MSKKSIIARQKKREYIAKRDSEKRERFKKQALDISLSEEEREEARIKLNKLPRDGSCVRLRNRCQFTGRPRGIYRKFKASRHCFREMSLNGLIPGITKASW